MSRSRPAATLAIGVALLVQGLGCAHALGAPASVNVRAAEALVDALDLSNTTYEHGVGSVSWSGTVASHTDCSGFVDQLLIHVDGYSPEDFQQWFGSRRPTAERYHDAIVAQRGFRLVETIRQLEPGDLIAIKYLTRHDNTGHIMLVVAPPRQVASTPPVVAGTSQWLVTVIDSAESGHGTTDTRHKRGADGRDHDGLGRGVVRLYADETGGVAGFSWSSMKVSRFLDPREEHVVLGRPVPGFRP